MCACFSSDTSHQNQSVSPSSELRLREPQWQMCVQHRSSMNLLVLDQYSVRVCRMVECVQLILFPIHPIYNSRNVKALVNNLLLARRHWTDIPGGHIFHTDLAQRLGGWETVYGALNCSEHTGYGYRCSKSTWPSASRRRRPRQDQLQER